VTEAKNRRIIVRVHVKSSAEQGKIPTKYENARRVAERFPVLTRELPPKRRAWESEHYRMSVFAAAALAMAPTARQERLYSGNAERRPRIATRSESRTEAV